MGLRFLNLYNFKHTMSGFLYISHIDRSPTLRLVTIHFGLDSSTILPFSECVSLRVLECIKPDECTLAIAYMVKMQRMIDTRPYYAHSTSAFRHAC